MSERYYHFPTPNGVNNTLRTGGKGSLSAKHNYEYVAIPNDFTTKGERNLTKTNGVFSGKPFKFVELFAGIGGFRAGLDKLGGECVLAVEWDKFAQQSYTALYGNEHLLGDVTEVDENDVPDHDVLVFGMPCQAFSVAGKRLGFEDMRGTLYFDAIRIAKAKKPKVLLMENVKGLVGHDGGRTLDVMAQAMSDIGYTIDFNVLNSKYFGVPQNRERIFMVGVRDDLVSEQHWAIKGTNVVAKGKRRIGELEGIKTFNFDWPSQKEVSTRLRDVLETEVDDKYYLSDEKTAKLVALLDEDDKKDTPSIIHNIYGGFNESKPRIFKDESPTIRTSAGGGHLPSLLESGSKYRIRKLTPLEAWKLQGFSAEQYNTVADAGISDSQMYKQAGNAVTVNVITAIGERLQAYID